MQHRSDTSRSRTRAASARYRPVWPVRPLRSDTFRRLRYRSASACFFFASSTISQRQPCEFDPVGACAASSRHSMITSRGTLRSRSRRSSGAWPAARRSSRDRISSCHPVLGRRKEAQCIRLVRDGSTRCSVSVSSSADPAAAAVGASAGIGTLRKRVPRRDSRFLVRMRDLDCAAVRVAPDARRRDDRLRRTDRSGACRRYRTAAADHRRRRRTRRRFFRHGRDVRRVVFLERAPRPRVVAVASRCGGAAHRFFLAGSCGVSHRTLSRFDCARSVVSVRHMSGISSAARAQCRSYRRLQAGRSRGRC